MMNSNAEAFAPQSGLFEFDRSLLLAAPDDPNRSGGPDSARGNGVMPSLRTSPAVSVASNPSPRDDLLLSPHGSRPSLGRSPARYQGVHATSAEYHEMYGRSQVGGGSGYQRLDRVSQPDNLYDGLSYGSSDPLPPPQLTSLHSSWPRYMEEPRGNMPPNQYQYHQQQQLARNLLLLEMTCG